MVSDLPRHLLKIAIALLKSPAKNFLGEEFMDAVGDALLEVGGEEAQGKIDEFLLTIEGTKQLQEVAKQADAHFQSNCKDPALLGAFSFSFGDLKDVQAAIQALPKSLDASAIEMELVEALERDLGDKLTQEQRIEGAKLYRRGLFYALAPLKKYTQTVISQTVLENSAKLDALGETVQKGVTELKALLQALLQRKLPYQIEASQEVKPGYLPYGSFLQNFERNPIFTGREEFLEKLADALLGKGEDDVIVTQAIAGMGGVGKTQLAIEFAYRYGYRFKGVHWLNATEARNLEELFPAIATCGTEMNLPDWPEESIPAQAKIVLGQWKLSGLRLVIVDNLEDLAAADGILPHLRNETIRLLVTSRYSDWPKTMPVQAISLEEFEPGESVDFLRKYLDEERASDEELKALAERLGHLPLALELAGRYLERHKSKSVPAYIGELNLEHASLSDWRAGELPNPTRHEMNVARTFAISWEAIKDEKARLVFKLGGYFIPNLPLPYQTLFWAAEFDDTDAFEESLMTLKAFALLKDDDSLHPLLAEFARLQDPEDSLLNAWAEALARQCYPGTRGGGIWHSPLLAQHAHYALEDLQNACSANREASNLAFYAAFLCRHFGDLDGAMKLYKESLEIKEGLGDLQGKSMTLGMLSKVLWANTRHEDAIHSLLSGLSTLIELQIEPQTQRAMASDLHSWRDEIGVERFDPIWQKITGESAIPDWLQTQEEQGLSPEQFIEMCVSAAREKRPEAAQLFEAAGKMVGDPGTPPEFRTLGKVLQKIMLGEKKPDLSRLPEELAKLVLGALEE